MVPDELYIASLVVHAAPSRLERIAAAVAALPGALVHASSAGGKLVVTLEAPTSAGITAGIEGIQRMDGVLSATLVYQCADSLAAMNEEISDA